jgi:phosphoribosyl 1,2-cyclic phosphodiesterase
MKLKVLGSSSKGNCYILESPTGSLLLECGLPFKEIQKELDFDLSDVVGCLVSHEHKDHCKAIKEVTLAGIDCYMSMGTLKTMEPLNSHRLMPIISGMQFDVNDFTVVPFDTEHDATQPLGYLIKYRPTGYKTLFLTDSYYCKYNYIKETLDTNITAGYVDERMKQRLLQSHFSLEHVIQFLKANDLSQCREIILLHLSSMNSDAARMIREIKEVTGITPKIAAPGLGVDLELYPY